MTRRNNWNVFTQLAPADCGFYILVIAFLCGTQWYPMMGYCFPRSLLGRSSLPYVAPSFRSPQDWLTELENGKVWKKVTNTKEHVWEEPLFLVDFPFNINQVTEDRHSSQVDVSARSAPATRQLSRLHRPRGSRRARGSRGCGPWCKTSRCLGGQLEYGGFHSHGGSPSYHPFSYDFPL